MFIQDIRSLAKIALLLGWKSPDQCIDLTDFDIPCEAVKAAEQFRTLDQKW